MMRGAGYLADRMVLAALAVVLACSAQAQASDAIHRVEGPEIDLVPVVAGGLHKPLFLTHAGDGTGRLYVVEQAGVIRLIEQGVLHKTPFLDISNRVRSIGHEQGLLGLAFHPDYQRNGRLFVNYTRQEDGATVLAEYRREGSAREASRVERVLMTVPQPYTNHNGGMIAFGPDGFLYVGRGDGGARGDPQNRAQNLTELLGKVLRINVDHDGPYTTPTDNPFAAGGGRPEIFAFGLRNPWRFSFDRKAGTLWLADVGQNKWEEVNVVRRGGNYGWRVMEGMHCYHPEKNCHRENLIEPVLEYGHEKGRCSVTGGYVYRGKMVADLYGWYLFGDFCSGEIFGMFAKDSRSESRELHVLKRTGKRLSSFGEDEAGEVYVVDHGGAVYRLVPSGAAPTP